MKKQRTHQFGYEDEIQPLIITQAKIFPNIKYLVALVIILMEMLLMPKITHAQEKPSQASQNWHMPDLSNAPIQTNSQGDYTEVKDSIPIRGTKYLIRVPKNWNGTLLNDLDYRQSADSPRNLFLLKNGYALSGTARRPGRLNNYDPAHEIHDLISVLDIFESVFGKPKQTIQLGCSGGGTVTLAMAEMHPDRIDGAIAGCASTSPWMANTHLDGLFVLKALIAPELPIVNLPLTDPEISKIASDWEKAIKNAQQTPEGRARIALAITIGQWPAWGGPGKAPIPEPDANNANDLQESMYQSLLKLLPSKQTFGTSMLEQSAPGQLRWNTGVDYQVSFSNGDALYKAAVQKLYKEAKIDLKKELKKINSFERVKADPNAVKWWSAPGRTHLGEPKVPLLRINTSGDGLVYPTMAQGYKELVLAKGYSDFFRLAYVNRWGHCSFSLSEWLAAIETVKQRVETGIWPKTDPETLNTLAKSLDIESEANFYDHRETKAYNRVWTPTTKDYLGTNK
ncbi:alpha/beta hydrolase [Zobellia uliginosa]|uniref:alpha/beta hydrolase n=1 Tax=Zobellia uliginosa TaxID=143224 RepID=UPI001C06781C|nr:alpha/beta hydrolase [Zobellia uliginosa]MBU2945507.1 alpha/beta hydrolase [Zobellia uliginosa]